MTLLPILGPPHEWFTLKKAVHYCGKHYDTLRDWVQTYAIGRQSVKNSRVDVSIPGLEMVRCGDLEALELLRAGDRSHPRVRHYLDRLTELGVIVPPEAILARKPFPTTPNPNLAPEVVLSDQCSGSSDGSAAGITPSFELETHQMRDEGPHAKVAERIRAILRSEEGKFLPNLANVLAFDLDLSASESLKILEVAAKDKRASIQ
ncbi:hypothetical protein [Rhizobium rhizogenes]|uniref:Uncharacterized protein n=1 Tax=Rhizobium rhizogenes (strain K84 / ATCC BAA-868) TaxID=311403 RepID=B9J9D3_RHIR8|nr:hypothetical protein Arad_3630 [Rhizobium rhizogenes K84]